METSTAAARTRTGLDDRYKDMGHPSQFRAPVRGWIKAVREALGMSTSQLARRLGVKQPSVIALQQSEVKQTIELATLRRVAEALDCQLIYALIPNKNLETIVRDKAADFDRRRLDPIRHSMLLENQQVRTGDSVDERARLDAIIREVNPRLFWD